MSSSPIKPNPHELVFQASRATSLVVALGALACIGVIAAHLAMGHTGFSYIPWVISAGVLGGVAVTCAVVEFVVGKRCFGV